MVTLTRQGAQAAVQHPPPAGCRRRWRAAALALAGTMATAASAQTASPTVVDAVQLAEIKRAAEIAIWESQLRNDRPPWFLVTKVVLSLKGNQVTRVDGTVGFSIPVFDAGVEFGGALQTSATETLSMDLAPPRSMVTGTPPRIDLGGIVAEVKDAFVTEVTGSADDTAETGGREDAAAAADDAPPAGPPQLGLRGFRYGKSWALRKTVDGKIDVVILEGGGETASTVGQHIEFHLCRTENRQNCVP